MKFTIRNIPRFVDAALRRRAEGQNKTLNEIAVQAITEALGLVPESPRQRSFRDIMSSQFKDASLEAARSDQRQVDPVLWR